MSSEHCYRTRLLWTGARNGPATDYASYSREFTVAIEGKPTLTGTADTAFKGDPALHNPEDLLVAALSGCHMLTYLALCVRHKIAVVSYEDEAEGIMVTEAGHGQFSKVTLRPRVTIAEGGDLSRAAELHDSAHKFCFIARSVNFPVDHHPEVATA